MLMLCLFALAVAGLIGGAVAVVVSSVPAAVLDALGVSDRRVPLALEAATAEPGCGAGAGTLGDMGDMGDGGDGIASPLLVGMGDGARPTDMVWRCRVGCKSAAGGGCSGLGASGARTVIRVCGVVRPAVAVGVAAAAAGVVVIVGVAAVGTGRAGESRGEWNGDGDGDASSVGSTGMSST